MNFIPTIVSSAYRWQKNVKFKYFSRPLSGFQVLFRVLTSVLKIGVKMLPSRKSWSFTILFHWDVAKSWSQRQKVGVKYSKFGDNENSAFQGKFHFQGLFKTDLHFQVLFKPVQTLQKTGEAEDGTSLVYCKTSILTITPWLLLWKVVALIKAMDDPEFINLLTIWSICEGTNHSPNDDY